MSSMKANPHVKRAWKLVGGSVPLARMLSIGQSTLSEWHTGRRLVPADVCINIEKVTGGVVRCEELRPDIDWAYLRSDRNRLALSSKPQSGGKHDE